MVLNSQTSVSQDRQCDSRESVRCHIIISCGTSVRLWWRRGVCAPFWFYTNHNIFPKCCAQNCGPYKWLQNLKISVAVPACVVLCSLSASLLSSYFSINSIIPKEASRTKKEMGEHTAYMRHKYVEDLAKIDRIYYSLDSSGWHRGMQNKMKNKKEFGVRERERGRGLSRILCKHTCIAQRVYPDVVYACVLLLLRLSHTVKSIPHIGHESHIDININVCGCFIHLPISSKT